MSQKLHIIACLAVLPLSANADVLPEPLRFFADCSGHVGAHLSVQTGGGSRSPWVEETRDALDSIQAILETMASPDQIRNAEARAREVREAHIALLAHAMMHGDLHASNRAAQQVARCVSSVVTRS